MYDDILCSVNIIQQTFDDVSYNSFIVWTGLKTEKLSKTR